MQLVFGFVSMRSNLCALIEDLKVKYFIFIGFTRFSKIRVELATFS